MKPSAIPFHVSDEAYAHAMQTQRRIIREAAACLDRGESLESMDKSSKTFLAIVLQEAACRLSDEQPRPAGRPPEFDPGAVAISFAILTGPLKHGVTEAYEELAEDHDVSVTAIKKAVAKYRDDAMRFVGLTPAKKRATKKRGD